MNFLDFEVLMSLFAGGVGAFGNQLLYWRGVIQVRDRKINRRMLPISAFYILTGALVGLFIHMDYPDSFLFKLGGGAAWPALLKSMSDVRQFSAAVQRKLGVGAGGT